MKTTFVVLLMGVIAVAVIVFLILWEIIELFMGIVGIIAALIVIGWLYKKVKNKLD